MSTDIVAINLCDHCGEPFVLGETVHLIPQLGEPTRRLRAYHSECQGRRILGSVAHHLHRCSCYGGNEDDPPELTKREAARLAIVTYERLQRGEPCS